MQSHIVKAKEIGDTLGIIIPTRIIKKENIHVGDSIIIHVEKRDTHRKNNPLKELFGTLKTGEPAEKVIKEIRAELSSKWME